eukprot:TRINITY_DN42430_c0_g1_i1.p1 TRINITY_DN42430_c0_g1~~TRINITY_DN42430_c0_g1_i1.p1  ORF type:complete len:175 (-),score=52.54 TRINITY_DN42430_c0_g1_i1:131-655(-)
MWLPWTAAWFLLAALRLEQAHGLRPEDEQKTHEPAAVETGQSHAPTEADANLEAMRKACGTAEGDKTVSLSKLRDCIQMQQKYAGEVDHSMSEIITAEKAVKEHYTKALELEQKIGNKDEMLKASRDSVATVEKVLVKRTEDAIGKANEITKLGAEKHDHSQAASAPASEPKTP